MIQESFRPLAMLNGHVQKAAAPLLETIGQINTSKPTISIIINIYINMLKSFLGRTAVQRPQIGIALFIKDYL
jgi:uncharacterized protein YybS (DUF2232 family)